MKTRDWIAAGVLLWLLWPRAPVEEVTERYWFPDLENPIPDSAATNPAAFPFFESPWWMDESNDFWAT